MAFQIHTRCSGWLATAVRGQRSDGVCGLLLEIMLESRRAGRWIGWYIVESQLPIQERIDSDGHDKGTYPCKGNNST
jgi:hypothetical protein